MNINQELKIEEDLNIENGTARMIKTLFFRIAAFWLATIILISPMPSIGQNFQWADGFGSGDLTGNSGFSTTSDPNGNVYITGSFRGTVTIGTETLTAGTVNDIFIAMYDENGVVQWARQAGAALFPTTNEAGFGIEFYDDGANGVVYLTGQYVADQVTPADFLGTNLFGEATTTNESDVFIAKIDATLGTLQWVQVITALGVTKARGISVDPSNGTVYFTGSHLDELTIFDQSGIVGTLPNLTATEDVFAAWYDTDGNFVGSFSIDGSGVDIAEDIDFYHDANTVTNYVYLTGTFNSVDLDWGSAGIVATSGANDAFIAKVDVDINDGAWVIDAGGGGRNEAYGLAVDSNGEVYFTGLTEGSMSFNDASGALGFSMTTSGSRDIFIAKYDANGNPIWSNSIESNGFDEGHAIVLDYNDESPWISGYVGGTGVSSATVNFGNDPAGNPFSLEASFGLTENVVLAHYDLSSGSIVEAFVVGGDMNQRGLGLATNDFRDIFVTGYSNGTAQFGAATTPTGTGGQDIFIAKMIPASFQNAFVGFEDLDLSEAAWADIDIDGDLDVIITGRDINALPLTNVYLNNNDETFTDLGQAGLPNLFNSAIDFYDINGDGDLDVLISGDNGSASVTALLENTTGSSFSDLSLALIGVKSGDVKFVDVDNNGFHDLFITGFASGGVPTTRIYVNNGNIGDYTETNPTNQYANADADWGDYDNDGDIDLLIAGFEEESGDGETAIWRNDGGSFTKVGLVVANTSPSVAWGDYDSDGDLDIFVSGYQLGGTVPESIILRNESNGSTFLDIGAGLTGLAVGDAQWGDYDNDGDLDVLVTGTPDGVNTQAVIFQNDGNNTFSEVDPGFVGTATGSIAFGNYDNDGDLDVLISGSDDEGDLNTILYSGNDDESNSPPDTPPTSLTSNTTGNDVTFSWDGSTITDDFTPTSGFTYNIYVGVNSGESQIVAPLSSISSGFRQVVDHGNTSHSESWTLTLPDGSYSWSVQAVDGAYAGSAFATEQTFTIGGAPPEISTSPSNLDVNVPEGQSVNQTFTISNTGTGDLNWNINSHIQDGMVGQFDGIDDYLVMPAGSALVSTQITVEAWIKPTGKTGEQSIIDHRAANGGWQLRLVGDSYPLGLALVLKDAGGNEDIQIANGVITSGDWQHVAAVYDGIDVTLYHNGITVFSGPPSSGFAFTGADISNWVIGATNSTDLPFQGSIDDLRVWDINRASVDIQDNAFLFLAGTTPNLVGWWNFDGVAGDFTNAFDKSTNSNDGVYTNGAAPASAADRPFAPGWVSGSAFSGTVSPAGSQDITVTLSAGILALGTYQTQLQLNSNDADESAIALPITMEVVTGSVIADVVDSTSLVALYNATGGDNWTDNSNWLTGPVSNWVGITLNSSGKVLGIQLPGNNLTGSFPEDLSLTDLQALDLSSNNLAGSIPTSISNFSQLTQLNLGGNNLSGEIPSSLWTLFLLQNLNLCCNNLSGSISDNISDLGQLATIELSQNSLTGMTAFLTIPSLTKIKLDQNDFDFIPDFSGLPNLTTLAVENNLLTFEDLVPNQPVTGFTFSPQQAFGASSSANKNEGESTQISFNIDASVSDNDYNWSLDGSFITNTGSASNLILPSLTGANTGIYTAEVSNPAFPGFTITSEPQYVTVSCLATPAGSSGETRVTLSMTGTTPGGSHPAHIHMNTAAVGGSIVLTFESVDGTTGESVSMVSAFDDSTPVTFQELLSYNGYVVVHENGGGPFAASGDIGSNAPDSAGVYGLIEVNGSGVSGTVTFESAGDEAEDSKVDRVVLGNIDNNTAGTTCESYSDFTNLSTDLGVGQSASITVTLGTCADHYPKFGKVYIDWDLSGDFDETELVASNAVPIDSTGTFEGNFTVPAGAQVGSSAKMRVVCWEAEYVSEGVTNFEVTDVSSCSDALFRWGETEDYTINLVELSLPDLIPQILSIDNTTITAGQSAAMTVRVLNQSSIEAAASTLNYYLSIDNVLDVGSDAFLGESPIGGILAFEADDFQGDVLIPASTAEGDYFLIFQADGNNEVSESDEGNNNAGVGISVLVAGDTIPPTISYVDRPEGYIPGTGGLTISVRATDADSGIDQVGYFFKKITDPGDDLLVDFIVGAAVQSSADTSLFEASFDDADFGTLGIEYFFVALDKAENGTFANLISRTTTVAFESQTLTGLTAGTEVVDYELISFPLEFENPSLTNIFDELGTYDAEVWRLFHWNSVSQGGYSERPATIAPGLGYWLIFANQATIILENTRAVDATHSRPFVMTLRNGWNQIGSPYLAALSWSDVLDHNITEGVISSGDVGNPFTYNRSFSETSSLQPFEGAFVEANGTINLQIPLQAVSGISGRTGAGLIPPIQNPLDAPDWEIRFDLNAGEYNYSIGGLGMRPDAEIGKDRYDRSALPRLSQYLDINFPHEEHIIPFFSRDIVPTNANHTWEFTIENSLKDKEITLSWDNEFFGVNSRHLVLYDVGLQKMVDMREVTSYSFGASPERKFKAVYGDLDYIENELQPDRLTLGDAYPNPFNQQTTIPYSLPDSNLDYQVNLSVYSSLGQKVITLVNEEQATGFYEILWNGKSEKGGPVLPGIYIYQLRVSGMADNPVLTGKLIVR